MLNPVDCTYCVHRCNCNSYNSFIPDGMHSMSCSNFQNEKGEGYYDVTGSRRYKLFEYSRSWAHPILHTIGVVLKDLFWLGVLAFFIWGILTELGILK